MRNPPSAPLSIAELQLSSPLPSPNRQQTIHSNASRHHTCANNISTSSTTANTNTNASPLISATLDPASISISTNNNNTIAPTLQFGHPHNQNLNLYPLATTATPKALQKFTFILDDKHCLFEEVFHNTSAARKRSASIWDDERSFKRTELEIDNNSSDKEMDMDEVENDEDEDEDIQMSSSVAAANSYSPGGGTTADMAVDIIPGSPNSALPSPVSDLDHDEPWTELEEGIDQTNNNNQDFTSDNNVFNYSATETPSTTIISPTFITTATNTNTTITSNSNNPFTNNDNANESLLLMDPASLVDMFDTLPENIQNYFMFQLLKRSPIGALRLANSTIMQVLKKDILSKVPKKVALHILSFMDIRSLCRATSVSRRWKKLIDNAADIWELKIQEQNFILTSKEEKACVDNMSKGPLFKSIARRHTVMRRNWRQNRHQKTLLEGHEEDLVTCLQFDEEKIITGSDDHSVNVYDIKTGELKKVLKGHDGGVWALQYVGNTLVTGSIDRTVRVWDIEKGICRFILRGHTSTVRCLKIVIPKETSFPGGIASDEPSEPIIVSGSRDTTIRVWRLPDLEEEPELPLSTSFNDDDISRSFLKFEMAKHEHSVRDLAVHGNILVSGSYDNNVIVWNLNHGVSLHILKGHTMKVYCVAIDPKRRHCISGSLDASVRIWGIDDGECKFVLQGHAILVGLLDIVDDILVSAAADATLRVWDPSNGDRRHIMAGSNGHHGPITSLQHDKHKIISGSEGGIKMWDTQTGELLHNMIEGVSGVWRVAFDERRCIAAVKSEHKTQLIVLDYGVHGLEDETRF